MMLFLLASPEGADAPASGGSKDLLWRGLRRAVFGSSASESEDLDNVTMAGRGVRLALLKGEVLWLEEAEWSPA